MANSSFAASANRSDRRIALRAKVPALAAGAPESWVEMAYESTWKGHPSGEFAFTRESFDDIVRIFGETSNPLPVTYGHPDHSSGRPTPAAGWIHELQVRNGDEGAELWARVAWTDEAAGFIRAGQYRYCSVVVDFAPIDRASGEQAGTCELYELALTNSPFLPDQNPITLSRVGAPARAKQRTLAMATPMDPSKMIEGVAKALGLKKDATPDEIKALIDAVFAFVSAMPGAVKSGPMPDATAAAAELSRFVKLADFPGLPEEEAPAEEAADATATMLLDALVKVTDLDGPALLAAVEANGDALKALLTGTPATGMSSDAQAAQLSRIATDARVVELSARVTASEAELSTLRSERAAILAEKTEARIAASFSRLVAEGKAGEGERATFLTLSAKSEEIALSAYDTRTPLLPPSGAPLLTGANAASKVGKSSAVDPMFLSIAKGEGHKGAAALARAEVLHSANHARNTDA